jgi:hypothetical protein
MPLIRMLSAAALVALLALTPAAQAKVSSFAVASQPAPPNTPEIVSTGHHGRTLVFTQEESVGFADLTDPAAPVVDTALVPAGGAVTSVAVRPKEDYALAAVQRAGTDVVLIIDMATRSVVDTIDVAEGPDAVDISPDGEWGAVAIENEGAGQGSIEILDLGAKAPTAWTATNRPIPADPDLLVPGDVQPEYVDINDRNVAAVTLQENNAVAIVDLPSQTVTDVWSAGTVNRLADIFNDGNIAFDDPYSAPRIPDGVAWTRKGEAVVLANEGEADLTGGRSFSIHRPDGTLIFDDGGATEREAAARGLYNDGRSDNKGIELENVDVGRMRGDDYAFVASERGHFLAVWNINSLSSPSLVDLVPTGDEPEGILALERRGLIVTADEEGGTLTVIEARGG